MDDTKHFDCLQGGEYDLPSTVSLMKFTAARIEEIQSMKKSLLATTSSKLAFQTLPKHMRRRTMSHNPKRVPKVLREKHINQMSKSGIPPPQKRPSRKHRRRPRNLQAEYVRRQRKITWLETHIWHAKRFHMVEKWGYRLPDRPCDKAFRACYRASARHCLIQDISYFSCVLIAGPLEVLLENFKKVCNSTVGLTFAAKAFLSGKRQGQTTLFNNDSNPKAAIGTVYFIWNPSDENTAECVRSIWIWIHAAFYTEALKCLVNCFSLKQSTEEGSANIYNNNVLNVVLEELKYDLSRFRLTGPLSTSVLQKALRIVDEASSNSDALESLSSLLEEYHIANKTGWYKDLLRDEKSKEILHNQKKVWNSLSNFTSVSGLSPHIVLSLIVFDPRYNIPKKRTKAIPEYENNFEQWCIDCNNFANISFSPLWHKDIRKHVRASKFPNKVINDMRSNLAVPGCELHHSGVPVPIVLIQRPGCTTEKVGYGSGWDIIVPAGWGQIFWISFIMWGARAGGLREFDSISFESSEQQFLAPDTCAGREEEVKLMKLHKKKYFSLPPNKRVNYCKLSILYPFSFNWKNLVQCWKKDKKPIHDFNVLRNKIQLKQLHNAIKNNLIDNSVDINANYIVPVKLEISGKGAPKVFGIICLPEPNDLLHMKAPIESLRADPNQQKRKELRKSHQLLLKRLRRKRKKSKQLGKIIPLNRQEMENYTKEIRKLWLPTYMEGIRSSSSREVVGRITKGGFSFTQGCYCARGYVALGALPHIISNKGKILVRDTSSLQYRFATIDVLY